MSRSCAVAFQSMNKTLGIDTRLKTLGLYRSLLRSSEKYELQQDMKSIIRNKFRSNKHLTSRPRVLDLLNEANKTEQFLDKGNNTDTQCTMRIQSYLSSQPLTKPPPPFKKPTTVTPKQVKRKPYQVAITTQHSSGYEFKRVRGWRQPVQTAMMLKNRVKTNQKRLNRFYELKSQLDMIRSEKQFLRNLKCLPKDGELEDYEQSIKMAMDENSKYHYNRKESMIEK